jgi:hypothetical protein
MDSQDNHELLNTLLRELNEITVADRIRQVTDARVQDGIDAALVERVLDYAGLPEERLAMRLAQLEREWSIERTLTLQSSSTALVGLLLGAASSRKWYLLTLVTSGFLLQHALQGWCPPLALHRRRGMRTQREIDLEIQMLKLARGDFDHLTRGGGSHPLAGGTPAPEPVGL